MAKFGQRKVIMDTPAHIENRNIEARARRDERVTEQKATQKKDLQRPSTNGK